MRVRKHGPSGIGASLARHAGTIVTVWLLAAILVYLALGGPSPQY